MFKCFIHYCTSHLVAFLGHLNRWRMQRGEAGDRGGHRRGCGRGDNGHSAKDRVGGWIVYGVLISWKDGYRLDVRVGVKVVTQVSVVVFVALNEGVVVQALVRDIRVVRVIGILAYIVQN